jgi:hypothetical protein
VRTVVARAELILEFELNSLGQRSIKVDYGLDSDESDASIYSYYFDKEVDEDQRTIEGIAVAFMDEFKLIEKEKLAQAHLKMLAFTVSARFGCVALVTYLLADVENEVIDLSYDDQPVFYMACCHYPGDVAQVSKVPQVSAEAFVGGNETKSVPGCTWARSHEKRQCAVVKLLLADERVDPTARDNWAFGHASSDGHLELSKLLLADGRVNPASNHNAAIRTASFNGHVEVLKLLLADEHPATDANYALIHMIRFGLVDMVCLLLEHPAVVVTEKAMSAAADRGDADIIALLLHKRPQVVLKLYCNEVDCVVGGAISQELQHWEKRSAFTMLMALQRAQPSQAAARVSDVLRDVFELYARIRIAEVPAGQY